MLPELSDIQKRRKSLGLTQSRLANLANVSQSLITKIESGKINPTYSKAKSLFNLIENLEKTKDIKVKEIMNPDIIRIDKNDRIENAVKLMRKYKISQLPVFNNKNVVGSISERDILDRIAKGEDLTDLSKENVETVMGEAFPRLDENIPLSLVSTLLQHNHAILITKKEDVIGIVTKADLLKVVHK